MSRCMGVCSLLKKFLTLFGFSFASSTQPQTADPAAIQTDERLSRFISDADHYRLSRQIDARLHFRAFLPSRKDSDELSVARTHHLGEGEIWVLGEKWITQETGRPVIARGDLTAS